MSVRRAALAPLPSRLSALGLAASMAFCSACAGTSRTDPNASRAAADRPPLPFDATTTYQSMGFLAAGAPLPFVASVRPLAGNHPDSTLLVLGVSMANSALRFRREGSVFVAGYTIDVVLRGPSFDIPLTTRENVRVGSARETERSDESIIFQRFIVAPPGAYEVAVTVRDRYGSAQSRALAAIEVPQFATGAAMAPPLPVYQAIPRGSVVEVPRLIVNPRATVAFGFDSLPIYLELYHAPRGTGAVVEAVDEFGTVFWQDTIRVTEARNVRGAIVVVPADRLAAGRLELVAWLPGSGAVHRVPMLVSFTDHWVTADLEEMVDLLRYFDGTNAVDSLRAAPRRDQSSRWREFWLSTDPDPRTPENEALEDYFRRLAVANARFREPSRAGWLTDRGEVFITLGEPDNIVESQRLEGIGIDAYRWFYQAHQAYLDFLDETGFGQYRLTPSSRSEYQRVLARARSRS